MEFEFFETPPAYVRYLFREVPIGGRIFEPCVGSGAIIRASDTVPVQRPLARRTWLTNDVDESWEASFHGDATTAQLWAAATAPFNGPIDWTVTNPAFSIWLAVLEHALQYSGIGVALHLRASVHEVLKTGPRRTFLAEHPPTGILWLPRFAYQRSKKTGEWTTDNVCACWSIWLKDPHARQFIRYAPESVIEELDAETPEFRQRMDALMVSRKAA